MRLARIPSALIGAVALSVSGISGVFAEHPATVGELIDKGGKKLGGEELTKLLSGSDVSGVLTSNPRFAFEATYKKDGTLEGRVVGALNDSGSAVRFWGKWSANERGELCADTQNNAAGGSSQSCTSYFELAGKYYQAIKDDKSQRVYHREIKR